ncbi:hypothetical protein F5B21DRAFT_430232 [Xylaria acuta]|nr:hypothetical protein F5B21DRAFT_430232 [Xylaria acuta]
MVGAMPLKYLVISNVSIWVYCWLPTVEPSALGPTGCGLSLGGLVGALWLSR